MAAKILNGNELATELKKKLALKVRTLKAEGIEPGLAVVLVGENPASISYVTAKEKDCESVGIRSFDYRLNTDTTQEKLLELIDSLNANPAVHGILVQLPLPGHLSEQAVLQRISPQKDVDGFHPFSLGQMVLGQDGFLPCTPHGILQLLKAHAIETSGRQIVIVGRSNIVGKPLAVLLMQAPWHATVTVCHTRTVNMSDHTRRADILIVAAGRPSTIKAQDVKPGAVVIDVGVNRQEKADHPKGFILVGDTDYQDLLPIAGAITPVPGGVGPLTRAMLLFNTLKSASKAQNSPWSLD